MQPINHPFSVLIRPQAIIFFFFVIILTYFNLDQRLAELIQKIDSPYLLSALGYISIFGEWFIYIIIFLIFGLYFRYVRTNSLWEYRCWLLGLSVLIPSSVSGVLKILLGRARPEMWLSEQHFGFYGFTLDHNFWSFPSGHTSAVIGLAIGLIIIFPRYRFLWLFAGFLMASSRILLLQHYLSDVLAAAYFAVLEIGLLIILLNKYSQPIINFIKRFKIAKIFFNS